MSSEIFRFRFDTILQLEQYIVTVQERWELQCFGSEGKVLFDTFSFKKKYDSLLPERCDIRMFRAATVMKNRKVFVYQSKRGDMAGSHVPSLVILIPN